MSQQVVTRCNVCGIEKGDTNNWFQVHVGECFICFFVGLNNVNNLDVCGTNCLLKMLGEWAAQKISDEASKKRAPTTVSYSGLQDFSV